MDPVQLTSAPTVSRKTLLLAAGGIILVCILALAGYFLLTSSKLAFAGMRYLAGTYEERALYEFTWSGTKQVTLPISGKLIDYARTGNTQVAIVGGDDGSQSVVLIKGKDVRSLVSGNNLLSGVSISADGKHVAFAERAATTPEENPRDFFAPTAWKVQVLAVESGEITSMGNGSAPHFFVRDGATYVAYMTPDALHIANLETNTHQDLQVGVKNATGAFPAVVSDDGAVVAVPTPAGVYTLLSLERVDGGAFVLGAVGSLPADAKTIAFNGSSAYSVGRSTGETFFYRSNVGAANTPTAFERMPFTFVTKLIP